MTKGRKVVGKFTEEMVRKVRLLDESVKGTTHYNKYYCMGEFKYDKKNWKFTGWYLPTRTGDLVKIGDNLYLYTTPYRWNDHIVTDRWLLCDGVRKALGLETEEDIELFGIFGFQDVPEKTDSFKPNCLHELLRGFEANL